ncbi:MAG: winged helix-turn-helix transcriptional regulator [Candidatus Heimdallarchaeota archaeon]
MVNPMTQVAQDEDAVVENEEDCAAIQTLKIVGRKWIAFIMCELLAESRLYFSDLLKNVQDKSGQSISAKVLSNSLNILEDHSIVEREIVQQKPVRVQYSLKEKGKDMEVILGALKGWGVKWGGVKHKKCRSFTCMHNAVQALDIEQAKELLHR